MTDLWSELLASLLRTHPGALCDFGAREDKIGEDVRLLAAMFDDGREREMLRLWDNEQRLVISRRLARLPDASDAIAALADRGWSVSVRASGGTTVVHRPGVLNISLFRMSHRQRKIVDGFDRLCSIIVRAAQDVGVSLDVGCMERSYCAGSHDIGWAGRKLAGTAGLMRRKGDRYGQLFHASLVVDGDWRGDLTAISAFERLAGMAVDYDVAAHGSLAEAVAINLADAA